MPYIDEEKLASTIAAILEKGIRRQMDIDFDQINLSMEKIIFFLYSCYLRNSVYQFEYFLMAKLLS